ncbi:DnaJ multi-domain protein [Pyrenophora teres f. maculata]|nr:DnaJ multi-domain protein [Pyrenophora teres f. maculata]
MYNSAMSRPVTRSRATAAAASVSPSTPPTALPGAGHPTTILATAGCPIAIRSATPIPTLTPPTPSAPRTPVLPFPTIRTPATKKRARTTNSTPSPPSRLPDTPFTFSPTDPNWADLENYTPWFLTPPPTPHSASPRLHPRPRPRPADLPAPINMTAYHVLDISNWKATRDTIKMAYRVAALAAHPDRPASLEDKMRATERMQRINAARDLLLSTSARRRYHRDGKVPWEEV